MRGHDEEAELDDARAAWRGYQQWQRQQYHDTPREYWDTLDTSLIIFQVDIFQI